MNYIFSGKYAIWNAISRKFISSHPTREAAEAGIEWILNHDRSRRAINPYRILKISQSILEALQEE